MTIEISSLSHDELVNLFSTALYGNEYISAEVPNGFEHLKKKGEGECYEDGLANVLLNGGAIDIYDWADADDVKPTRYSWYGVKNLNWTSHCMKKVVRNNFFFGEQTLYVPTYRITLETLLKGMSRNSASKLVTELFIDEEGDMDTAYNLLQIAIFGEEIYG